MLTVCGKTSDDKLVVRGVFAFYETHGLALDVIFEALMAHGYIPDWRAFMDEATKAGMQPSRVLSMLDPAIVDSYGSAMRDVVLGRLSV